MDGWMNEWMDPHLGGDVDGGVLLQQELDHVQLTKVTRRM